MDQNKPKSALEIIQGILDSVESKRKKEVEEARNKDKNDQTQLSGGESMPDYKGYDVYLAYDGDDIGNAVARAEETDDEETLSEVSNAIKAGNDVFEEFILSQGGKMIQSGGDEGLGQVNSKALNLLEEFRENYKNVVGATVTVGVGEKISEATKARMLGKLRGKDQVCHWTEQTETEIGLRQLEQDPESKKLEAAGLIKPQANDQEEPQDTQQKQPNEDSISEPQQNEAPQDKFYEDSPSSKDNGLGSDPETGKPYKLHDESQDHTDMEFPPSEEEGASVEEKPPEDTDEEEQKPLDIPQNIKDHYKSTKKPESLFKADDEKHYDENIENGDYSQDEYPDAVKRILYSLKNGK